jgi:pyruvate dehydrogenase E1 component beta subunit
MGVDVEVIDLRTIRPMDLPTVIASVKKTNRLVCGRRGLPAVIGRRFCRQPGVAAGAFDFLDAPVITIAGKDVPMPYAANLEKLALPNVGEVIAAVKAVTYR